jgi:hypothetical protein
VSIPRFGHGASVAETWTIRGRQIDRGDLEQIQSWIKAHPQWSRRRLSEELVRRWDGRTPSGQLKDIATRDVLNSLEGRGLIRLPARQRRGGRQRPRALLLADQQELPLLLQPAPAPTSLWELLPLSWQRVQRGQRALVARYLHQDHYLGYPDPLGQIHYLVRDRRGREVACLLFGPAAWKVAARDRFIGWSELERRRGLKHLANNSRFLILPGYHVPGLASHLLGQGVRQLRRDWPAQHGVPLWLVETFVEQGRFVGTSYRAANWLGVGQTQGRTRNDRLHRRRVPPKDVYLLPLVADFRQRLGVA